MLDIRELRKVFSSKRSEEKDVVAVDGVSLTVEAGQFFTLLGPSGCGKTTTLRSVAGLERPDAGEIVLDDVVLFSSQERVHVPSNRRRLGMVFQSYAIWPHLTVAQNIAFPLACLPRDRRPSRSDIRQRVEQVLEVVQLPELIDRPSTDLSGGQQQRLALARALVAEPPLLLLDEPLSNLDAKLREDTRVQLKRLQRELGITTVYVTHDQVEALAMSDVVAVMNHGVVEQLGTPREIYERPASHFVADFIGTANFVEGTVESRSDGEYLVQTDAGPLLGTSRHDITPGDRVMASFRPEAVRMERGTPTDTAPGRWGGLMETRAFLGGSVDHLVRVAGREVQVRTRPSESLGPRTEVTLRIPPEHCFVVPVE